MHTQYPSTPGESRAQKISRQEENSENFPKKFSQKFKKKFSERKVVTTFPKFSIQKKAQL